MAYFSTTGDQSQDQVCNRDTRTVPVIVLPGYDDILLRINFVGSHDKSAHKLQRRRGRELTVRDFDKGCADRICLRYGELQTQAKTESSQL